MINYFLKSNSKIKNILKQNAIDFNDLDIEGVNGVIITQPNLLAFRKILNKTFDEDINPTNSRNTRYEGIKQVFISDYKNSYHYENLKILEREKHFLEKIEDVDIEINKLKAYRRSIENEMKCINDIIIL